MPVIAPGEVPPPIVTTADLTSYQAGDAQGLIDQATALVRRYCGWHVTPELTETLTLNGSGNGVQILPSLRVASIASVTHDGTLLTADDDYTWSAAGWIEYVAAGPYFSEAGLWATAPGKVVVELTHGYTDAPDLAGVILARASRMQGNPNAATRTQVGQVSEQVEVASGFTADERATLDLYRLAPRP